MRFVRNSVAALALLVIGICEVSSATAADRDARSAIQGRQQIRAELAAALAKGQLTQKDQRQLLLHAKQVLSDDDLQGFQRTLDRIVAQQATRSTAMSLRDEIAGPTPEADDVHVIATSKYEEPDGSTRLAAATEPAPEHAISSNEAAAKPFLEEVPAIGRPSLKLSCDEADACGCDDGCEDFRPNRQWFALDLFTGIDAFKGPLDVGNANGNFGVRLGLNGAVSIMPKYGVALQAGMAADLTNFKGSPYPFPNATMRDQIFTTVGMFQRINLNSGGAVSWGFVYDWLFDDYYANFRFGQWRVKGEYEVDPTNAFGIQASLPEHGSTEDTLVNIDGSPLVLSFRPLTQGSLYWTHTFGNYASLTGRFGVAERPSNFIFGGDGRVPVTRNMALTGSFTYIMPNAGASDIAQTQEMWNVSVGIELVPGGFRRCNSVLRPFLPVADNGSLAVREAD